MQFQPNAESIPFGITVLIAAGLALLAWRRRGRGDDAAMAAAFAVMMAGEAAWALFEAMELVIVDLPIKRIVLRDAGRRGHDDAARDAGVRPALHRARPMAGPAPVRRDRRADGWR